MSIADLLKQIRDEKIVLPAIQRDFVWHEDKGNKILRLLDSVMRGYPIGLVLLWETYEDIQYRTFVQDYKSGNLYTYRKNPQRKKLKLVLDGQQRLQSLYIALYGTLEGKSLYFDVLSGRDSDDVAEEKYLFYFATPKEAEKRNSDVEKELVKPADRRAKNFVLEYLFNVSELFKMGVTEKMDLVWDLSKKLSLSDKDRKRLDLNLRKFDDALSKDENILKVSVIDEGLDPELSDRKSAADMLEIFVRVNREGTPLNRSDLIFSMLKLNWEESAEELPEFVRKINEGNSFDLDTDFVIRSLFAVSDLGTKFDRDRLRKKTDVAKLKENFQRCCDAIRATVKFLQKDCWCASSRLIGGAHTLIPFVYYFFHTKNHQIRNDQVVNARKALYLFGFSKLFSRYADSRLGAFIKEVLSPLASKGDETFPLKEAVRWVGSRERIKTYGKELLQANPKLALCLVQGLTGAKVQDERNAPEVDHIFPRSKLRKKGYNKDRINDIANLWILPKGKNRNKSNKDPADYFRDVPDEELKKALIDRKLLDYRRYNTFIKTRSERLLERVKQKLQFDDEDFKINEGSEE